MKFKILPKVDGFSFAKNHVRYYPGDIVDLPASYLGEPWLMPLEKPVEQKPIAKLESAAGLEQPIPLELKTQKKRSRKSKSEY